MVLLFGFFNVKPTTMLDMFTRNDFLGHAKSYNICVQIKIEIGTKRNETKRRFTKIHKSIGNFHGKWLQSCQSRPINQYRLFRSLTQKCIIANKQRKRQIAILQSNDDEDERKKKRIVVLILNQLPVGNKQNPENAK